MAPRGPAGRHPPSLIGDFHAHRHRRDFQEFRHDDRAAPGVARHSLGRDGLAAWPVRLGQDHAAAHLGRAGTAKRRAGAARRRGRHWHPGSTAAHRLRVPELRALSPHDGVREHRLRSARPTAPHPPRQCRDHPPRRAAARVDPTAAGRRALSQPAVGRPAPAGRAGACAGTRAAHAAARRALRSARRQGAPRAARRVARDPRCNGTYHRFRHP